MPKTSTRVGKTNLILSVMKKLQFPTISEVEFKNLKKMGKGRMKSVKGGYTSHTITLPDQTSAGDDGVKND